MFKHQLFSLTGVPPERQKIMVKGGMLKDDADMAKLGLKEGQKLMIMGSADKARLAAPRQSPERRCFLEIHLYAFKCFHSLPARSKVWEASWRTQPAALCCAC